MACVFALLVSGCGPAAPPRSRPRATPEARLLCTGLELSVESSRTFVLPKFQAGQRAVLRVRTRTKNKNHAGWSYVLRLQVNGRPVDAALDRQTPILTNHKPYFKSRTGNYYPWNTGNGIWLSFFSPGFSEAPPRLIEKQGYTYVLDVTRLLRAGRRNIVTLQNVATRAMANRYAISYTLVLDARVRIFTDPTLLPREPCNKRRLTLKFPTRFSLSKTGELIVNSSGTPLRFMASFSHPGGGWNHFGHLAQSSGSRLWRPVVTRLGPGRWRVVARSEQYVVRRDIVQLGDRIDITDSLLNSTRKRLAIRYVNAWRTLDACVPHCRIGGVPNDARNDVPSAENPTLFIPLNSSSVGITINDDVYRNHAIFFYDATNRRIGAKDDSFALGPLATYSTSLSIHLLRSTDYFDFINAVRDHWKSNIPLRGPFYWLRHEEALKIPAKRLKRLVGQLRIRYMGFWELGSTKPVPGWRGRRAYAHGAAALEPELDASFRELSRAAVRLHRLLPTVRLSPYTHSFFQGLERPGDRRFIDSWITDRMGRRCRSQYYWQTHVRYQTVLPSLTNRYGRTYRRVVERFRRAVGAGWWYWDEANGPGMFGCGTGLSAKSTFNAWDGHSAIIDKRSNRLLRAHAILPLISDPFIVSLASTIQKSNGPVLFNGPPVTRRKARFLSMAECHSDFARVYTTHLSTPLVYSAAKPTMKNLRKYLFAGALRINNRPSLVTGSLAMTRFFPITPVQLRPGWIVGQERIITAVSGTYGWRPPFSATLYYFNRAGSQIRTIAKKNKTSKLHVEVPVGGLVVLVKSRLR